jgi:hypothetical protein
MVGITEAAPENVGAFTEGLTNDTPTREGDVATNDRSERLKRIALDYLRISKVRLQEAAQVRIQYVLLAKQYGVSNVAIGEALGIGESAVRGMLAQYGGDA